MEVGEAAVVDRIGAIHLANALEQRGTVAADAISERTRTQEQAGAGQARRQVLARKVANSQHGVLDDSTRYSFLS